MMQWVVVYRGFFRAARTAVICRIFCYGLHYCYLWSPYLVLLRFTEWARSLHLWNKSQCVNLCIFLIVTELVIPWQIALCILSYGVVLYISDKQIANACKTHNKYSVTFMLASFVCESFRQNANVLMKTEVRLNCFLVKSVGVWKKTCNECPENHCSVNAVKTVVDEIDKTCPIANAIYLEWTKQRRHPTHFLIDICGCGHIKLFFSANVISFCCCCNNCLYCGSHYFWTTEWLHFSTLLLRNGITQHWQWYFVRNYVTKISLVFLLMLGFVSLGPFHCA